jgi:high-affinity iron transporter
VRAALLTGMFGLQPRPTHAEVLAWLVYAIPMGFLVLVPRRPKTERMSQPDPEPVLAV